MESVEVDLLMDTKQVDQQCMIDWVSELMIKEWVNEQGRQEEEHLKFLPS